MLSSKPYNSIHRWWSTDQAPAIVLDFFYEEEHSVISHKSILYMSYTKSVLSIVALKLMCFFVIQCYHLDSIIRVHFVIWSWVIWVENTALPIKMFDVPISHIDTASCKIEQKVTPILLVLSNVCFYNKVLVIYVADIQHKRLDLGLEHFWLNCRHTQAE